MTATLVTVVGARPQFVKAAPLSRVLRETFREVLVHTGQHYDPGMSETFFRELDIPPPDVNLGVGSLSHGRQTAAMRAGLTEVIRDADPFAVVTYGDTNSTLAASLAALEAGCGLAHVEAGLRSFNLRMPEEVNRIAADHLSDLCLCPTRTAVENLTLEGVGDRALLVGDVMLDACLAARDRAGGETPGRFGLERGEYAFATVHRAENTDHPTRLGGALDGLGRAGMPVLFAVHPRTQKVLDRLGMDLPANVTGVPPLSYLETMALVADAALVFTDSGGLQKEAFFLGTPCVTLRDETEWTETVASGWNRLVGADPDPIAAAARDATGPGGERDLDQYGGGHACLRIRDALSRMAGLSI